MSDKPRTLFEALALTGELAALVVLILTAVSVSMGIGNSTTFESTLAVMIPLNLACTVPMLIVHGGRLVWAKLLWHQQLKSEEVVAGETLRWPRRPIMLRGLEREGHIGIFGATRSGKSTLAQALAAQDIQLGRPTIVVDPHAAMAEALTAHALEKGRLPCLLQAADGYLATLNLLETGPTYSAFDAARTVAEGLSNVYIPYQEELPVRLRNVLETAAYFLAQADEGYTILELPRYVLQPQFREYLAKKVADTNRASRWLEPDHALTSLSWLNSLTRTQLHQQMQSTWTRLAGLLSAPDVRRIFGSSKSSFPFPEVFEGAPLLLAMERERLHHGAHLANGMLLTWITHRLMTRPAGPAGFHAPLYMYLDELAEVTPSVFEALLLAAGKRSVRLTLIVQAQSMLHTRLRKSLMANLNTLFVFRSAGEGVAELAKEVFVPPTFDAEVAFGGRPTSQREHELELERRIRSLPQHQYLFASSNRPRLLLRGTSLLGQLRSPEEGSAAKRHTLRQRGKSVQELDREIRKRVSELNTRFGPLQEYSNDQLLREIAPW